MPPQRPMFAQRPKGKTPAERSVEFDAQQAQMKADAAARREARAAAEAAGESKRSR